MRFKQIFYHKNKEQITINQKKKKIIYNTEKPNSSSQKTNLLLILKDKSFQIEETNKSNPQNNF